MISIPRLCSLSMLRERVVEASGSYTFIKFEDKEILLGYRCCERMMQFAEDTGAAMVYSDYYDPAPHPLIDYQMGSLRDDFDFGGLWLIRTDLLSNFFNTVSGELEFVAPYALRLFASRMGKILHLREMLYTQVETDLRKSGEKQFDYVDPKNVSVQKEAEQVCTEHLKAIGAWLSEEDIDELPADNREYPVEVSVIIPVRNRERTIADAISSVLQQKADFAYNVLVVDNHSTDGTGEAIAAFADDGRVVRLCPDRDDLGIGGCWDMAIRSEQCGRYAVQLDSDDIYSGEDTLKRIVEKFREENAAMVIGSYRMVDFQLNTLPPGLIDHKEWTAANGRNNALRINGLGAPRAFRTDILRRIGFPNTSYGEDYALGLAISRRWRIGRIYDELYLCRRWEGNSDAALSIEKQNKNNLYKDLLRTEELLARQQIIKEWGREVDEDEVNLFFNKQMCSWDEARTRFEELKTEVMTKSLPSSLSEETPVSLLYAQHNPCRIVSTGAKIDAKTISERPCFLCDKNRPAAQISLPIEGKWQVLVNPFPILPHHLTISSRKHIPQALSSGLDILLSRMAWEMPGYVVFYNGPRCGASAPDHAHLQAGERGYVPIERDWKRYEDKLEKLYPLTHDDAAKIEQEEKGKCGIYLLKGYPSPAIVIIGEKAGEAKLLNKVMAALGGEDNQSEGRAGVNVIAWRQHDEVSREENLVTVVFPRRKHRPECYFAEGNEQMVISPGAVDMGGLLVAARRQDYERLTYEIASQILSEVSMTEEEVKGIFRG